MKKIIKLYSPLFFIAALVVLLDQATKQWVRNNLDLSQIYRPDLPITHYVRLTHVLNSGAANGLFNEMGDLVFWVMLIVILGVILAYPRLARYGWAPRLALGLILGGGLGNMIDRLAQDMQVTDFISVLGLPIFNLADIAVLLGAGLLLAWYYRLEPQDKNFDTPPTSEA